MNGDTPVAHLHAPAHAGLAAPAFIGDAVDVNHLTGIP